jgi:predicted NAD-dependent protein-ADP-ribosyltransferase YbiA (DUF1768 family)
MDIKSGCNYPASALSNFSPHPFEIDGIKCNSMEGFLQSLKFKDENMQKYVCTLTGSTAKFKGKPKKWWFTQTLWWKGKEIDRHSDEYQQLLDRAYSELSKNEGFKKALLATGDANLTHSIGKNNASHTILTEREFCGRLMKLRKELKTI